MATITSKMTTADINKALKTNRKIVFSSGTYNLTAPLILYSNTTITCKPNVVFIRKQPYDMIRTFADKNTTAYNGCHDITWKGGQFIADTMKDTDYANIFIIVHAKNITLDNIIFEGCRGLHTIELNSSYDVTIKNCTIKRQSYKPGESYREGIQIDFAFKGGVAVTGGANPTDKCYDATHCKNITISKCNFIDCPDGIGTHTIYEKDIYHENIVIKDCTFTNMHKWGIKLLGMKNVTIKNCNTKVVVNKKKTAHTLTKGKVELKNYKCCSEVMIDNLKVV